MLYVSRYANFAAVIVLIFSTPISKFDHGSLRGHHADLV